jgi:hypothetical protein
MRKSLERHALFSVVTQVVGLTRVPGFERVRVRGEYFAGARRLWRAATGGPPAISGVRRASRPIRGLKGTFPESSARGPGPSTSRHLRHTGRSASLDAASGAYYCHRWIRRCSGQSTQRITILPLRNAVLFPMSVVPINVGRPPSVRVVEDLVGQERASSGRHPALAGHDRMTFESLRDRTLASGQVIRLGPGTTASS